MSEERRRIGPYEVVRLLGKGGMSEVYEAENPRLGSRHALKLFTYEKDDPEVKERFMVEGKLLARLNHPRIVKVTDFGVEDAAREDTSSTGQSVLRLSSGADTGKARPYFVMDLVLNERGELQLLSDVEPGTVDEETVGRWYDDLREGLAYIHSNGVIHRDLKLQNVLIGPDGHAVLTDFGISKIFDAKGDGVQIVDTVRTLVKVREGRSLVMGSLGYMAPELEMGVAASPQSDWYALGVIIYRLLTGTWCDARTDVVGTLETYDPVWKRIIPKLLHSNPQGRECLSYADEKRADRERSEFEMEERWLKEKARGHFARHTARWIAAGLCLTVVALSVLAFKYRIDRKIQVTETILAGDSYRTPYDFDTIFRIPLSVRAERMSGIGDAIIVPSRAEIARARTDLLVITHPVFSDLNSGKITVERAISDLERMQACFASNSTEPFDRWPEGYLQMGSDEVIYWFLDRGLEKLRGLAYR